jgi:hypothetical protein
MDSCDQLPGISAASDVAKEAGCKIYLFILLQHMEPAVTTWSRRKRHCGPSAYAISSAGGREIARLADDHFSPVYLRNSTVYGVSPMLRLI